MIYYFIAALQYSLTASLLTALFYGAAARFETERQRKALTWGLTGGIVFALILAVLRRTTAINRGMVNAGVLILSIIAVLCFIPFMGNLFKKNGSRFHEAGFSWFGAIGTGTLWAYAAPSLFLLPSEFILAGQTVFSTEFLLKSAGALAGAGTALLIALGVFHAAKGAGVFTFRIVFTLILGINLLQQGATVVQFLLARRIIPMIRWLFRLMMNAVNHEAFFLYAAIFVALALPAGLLAGQGKRAAPKDSPPRNPAEKRKLRAGLRRDRRRGILGAAGLVLAFGSLTGLKAWDQREVTLSPAEPMQAAGREIIIPLEQVEDGRLHRFAWNAQGNVEVRFIVIKKNAAAYGVGLDACDICGSTGYYERRDEVICRLCDVVMNKSTIGFKGGCNPVPLAYTVREGAMIVQIEDLEKEKTRFQ
jgi:uncharacterized membrane protein